MIKLKHSDKNIVRAQQIQATMMMMMMILLYELYVLSVQRYL